MIFPECTVIWLLVLLPDALATTVGVYDSRRLPSFTCSPSPNLLGNSCCPLAGLTRTPRGYGFPDPVQNPLSLLSRTNALVWSDIAFRSISSSAQESLKIGIPGSMRARAVPIEEYSSRFLFFLLGSLQETLGIRFGAWHLRSR